jgi:glutamate carboxypeptidase
MLNITNAERAVLEWLDMEKPEMLRLLEALVNTDSSSYDKQGVDAAGEVLKKYFERHEISVRVISHPIYGEAISAVVEQPKASDPRPIVLMGHRDTVFSKGESAKRPFRIEGNFAYGPGVADMKAGLVMNASVMAAFRAHGGHPAQLIALVTGDEEIASPSSRPIIEETTRAACAVFNAEPGRPTGNIVTGRKGGVFMILEVFGKAAHSGVSFYDGCSAIEELALKITKLSKLTDVKTGTTVNVGLVRGGQTVNTVAPYAAGEIDLRYVKPSDRETVLKEIVSIASQCSVPGTSGVLKIKGEFLPLNPTLASRRLLEIYQAAAAILDLKIEGEFTGGCADSGFAAAQGAPTLCGLGPVGGKAHSPEEYMEVDSLVPRAQVLALSILRLAGHANP